MRKGLEDSDEELNCSNNKIHKKANGKAVLKLLSTSKVDTRTNVITNKLS